MRVVFKKVFRKHINQERGGEETQEKKDSKDIEQIFLALKLLIYE